MFLFALFIAVKIEVIIKILFFVCAVKEYLFYSPSKITIVQSLTSAIYLPKKKKKTLLVKGTAFNLLAQYSKCCPFFHRVYLKFMQ